MPYLKYNKELIGFQSSFSDRNLISMYNSHMQHLCQSLYFLYHYCKHNTEVHTHSLSAIILCTQQIQQTVKQLLAIAKICFKYRNLNFNPRPNYYVYTKCPRNTSCQLLFKQQTQSFYYSLQQNKTRKCFSLFVPQFNSTKQIY